MCERVNNSDVEMRKCKECGIEKPYVRSEFERGSRVCRKCLYAKSRKRYANKKAANISDARLCKKCGCSFKIDKNAKVVRRICPNCLLSKVCSKCGFPGEFREGHKQCRNCERSYGRERHYLNKEKEAAYRKTHREKYRKLNVKISKRRRTERHAELDRIKNVPCVDCNKIFSPYIMDFDHRDPSEKLYEISYLINKSTAPWSRILEEIKKCDIICVNCHRLRTWKKGSQSLFLEKRRKLSIKLKDVSCFDCGKRFHYSQMDFDHVRGEKIGPVSQMKSCKAVLEEAAKCDVVCANCHRKRTHQQNKGQHRLDPTTINMVWERRASGPQTVVALPKPKIKPNFRIWHVLAGTMLDKEIAKQFGISGASITHYRKLMNIPRFRLSIYKPRFIPG